MSEFEIPEVDFAEAVVLAAAREKTGLEDFGDESFREPLRQLLHSLDAEAELHAMGRFVQHQRIVDSLAMRLSFQADLTRHPEILEEEIRAPIVIVGLARTGTTMLHRLLSADPRAYSARWWEVRSPAPFADWDGREPDPRIADAHEQVKLILETQPVLASIHPWDAEGPDEEIMLIEHSFLSTVPESGADLPSYNAWLAEQDMRPGYAYGKRLIQYLQWQKKRRGERCDWWVLKTPMHLGYLDLLFEAFPDARVIQTHRDPIETIPSITSMHFALWGLARDDVDPHLVGRQALARYASAIRRSLAVRDETPDDRFVDVWFRDVAADPIAAVQAIYASLGVEWNDACADAMRKWSTDNTRDKRPAHEYGLEQFGFTPEQIEAEFAAYRERFILSREP